MSREESTAIGAAGEAAVTAELAAAGFHVYVPAFGSPEADLLAVKAGKVISVQVKTLTGDTDSLSFDLRTSTKKTYTGTVDWMALHSLHHRITAFLKPEEVGSRLALRYDGQSAPNRHSAADYSLERVIKELSA